MKRKRTFTNVTGKSFVAQNEISFTAAAARGNPARGLRLLEKLNRQDRKNRIAGTKP